MKRFLWFALWLATAGGAFAQEADPYAGQKAQIREIKLSNEYYYSDVSSEDPEETRGMARQHLVLAIQQEDPGFTHDGAAQGDTLPLAAGQRLRLTIQQMGDIQDPGRFIYPALDFILGGFTKL